MQGMAFEQEHNHDRNADHLNAQLVDVAADAFDGLYRQCQSAFIEQVWNGVDGFERVAESLDVSTDPISMLDDYPNAHDPMGDGRDSDGEVWPIATLNHSLTPCLTCRTLFLGPGFA